MDLSLTQEQEMFKSAVRSFVQQEYPKERLLEIASSDEPSTSPQLAPGWQQLLNTGWLGIVVPQEYGGEGGSFTDAGVLFEELGRGPVPGPHITSCVLAASAMMKGGTDTQKRDWLPALVRGNRVLAPALTEAEYSLDPEDVRTIARRGRPRTSGERDKGLRL